MLVFSQKTGFLQSILLDDGYLTNIRTALAGRIAARYLAPRTVNAIGIYGTGAMARLQLTYLASVTDCREVVVWGRSEEGLDRYCEDISALGYSVTPTRKSSDVTDACNVIVTTTPSVQPLIMQKPGAPRDTYHRRWFRYAGETGTGRTHPGHCQSRYCRQHRTMPLTRGNIPCHS